MPSLLVPISVAAKIVKAQTPVPSLAGDPFNTALSLEPGIHVHWALPDALTRARHIGEDSGSNTPPQQVIFPGVPDLWLVTRFNPPAAGVPRTWKAWVVDSRAKTVTSLDKWTAPTAPDTTTVHTLPGVLPPAPGNAGWGVFQAGDARFDDAITSAVYYPTGRARFGFYDDLSSVPSAGIVSYTVIGWYSSNAGDPLYNAANRMQQIQTWGLSYDPHLHILDLQPAVSPQVRSTWKPQLQVAPHAQPVRAVTALSAEVAAETAVRATRLSAVQSAIAGQQVSHIPVFTEIVPDRIVCHGSVTSVPLNATLANRQIATGQIAVYPSLKRAMAAVASPGNSNPQQLDYTEMLLQDLDHLKGTMAGVVDMPAAAHALTFQSIPGTPSYYAQIVISDPPPVAAANQFSIVAAQATLATGHWPDVFVGKAVSPAKLQINPTPIVTGIAPPFQAPPPQPTPAQISDWLNKVNAAFNAVAAKAKTAGTPIDPKMVRVVDKRSKAQPLRLAPSVDGRGTDGGGYWVQIDDTDSLTRILTSTTGAQVTLPDTAGLYSQPGPRWYRPWSPQIVLTNIGRGYRFGEDGRFDTTHGTLLCRTSGYTVYGIYSNTGTLVPGSAAMANAAGITSVAGLPADSEALLFESAVLDPSSAPSLTAPLPAAQRAAAQTYFGSAIQAVYLERFSKFSTTSAMFTPAVQAALGKVQVAGTAPSPAAITPWQDPSDPLFLDARYSLLRSSLENDWQLQEDQVEMSPATPAATNPPATQAETIQERAKVTSTITKVLASALVTRQSLNPVGQLRARQNPPNSLTSDAFQTMDLVSAPLTGFDAVLFARNYRERAGLLQVNKINLIDVFGTASTWDAGSAAGPSTVMPPRLPYWSRLSFRLRSADQSQDANSQNPSICGILLPDFLDHSVQVFDGSGNSIGELRNGTDPVQPEVQFTPYPWVTPPAADPLSAIANPILRQVVAGITAQPRVNVPGALIHESALTSMLRAIDTVRATLDPSYRTPDHKVSLMGEPILVMVARAQWQTTAESDPAKAAQGAPLAQPPSTPTIPLRIGDILRPDDGVLGCFLPNDSPANSRFSPVSKSAADNAILNGLTAGLPFNNQNGLPVTHPFVLHRQNVTGISADTPQDLILLTDIRGDIYATCGVLPRKSITVPKDFLDAALRNMEPVFGVGPVLTFAAQAGVTPLFPPPQVQGYDASYLTDAADPGAPMPPSPPLGDLPPQRVSLKEGWVRLEMRKK